MVNRYLDRLIDRAKKSKYKLGAPVLLITGKQDDTQVLEHLLAGGRLSLNQIQRALCDDPGDLSPEMRTLRSWFRFKADNPQYQIGIDIRRGYTGRDADEATILCRLASS